MKFLHVFCVTALLHFPFPASAEEQFGGQVEQLIPSANSFTFLASVESSGVPACAGGTANFWTVDTTTPQGQAIAATVLTSFASGRRIKIHGTGACLASQSDVEQVFYVVVEK
jgi:hypothetical protein